MGDTVYFDLDSRGGGYNPERNTYFPEVIRQIEETDSKGAEGEVNTESNEVGSARYHAVQRDNCSTHVLCGWSLPSYNLFGPAPTTLRGSQDTRGSQCDNR